MFKKMKRKATACLLCCISLFGICVARSGDDDFEIYSTLYGVVTDYVTGKPVEGATLTLSPSSYTQKSDAVGAYRFEKLDAQQYTITVQKTGYQPNRKTVTAISGEEMEINIPLTKIKNEDNN